MVSTTSGGGRTSGGFRACNCLPVAGDILQGYTTVVTLASVTLASLQGYTTGVTLTWIYYCCCNTRDTTVIYITLLWCCNTRLTIPNKAPRQPFYTGDPHNIKKYCKEMPSFVVMKGMKSQGTVVEILPHLGPAKQANH